LKQEHLAHCQHPDCKDSDRGIFAIKSTGCSIHPYSTRWNLDKKPNYKGDTTPPPFEPKKEKAMGNLLQVAKEVKAKFGKTGKAKTGKAKNQKTKR
jgi:hypothetical protein